MSVTVTSRDSGQTGSVNNFASNSFQPTANSKLYVWAFAENNNHSVAKNWAITNTGGLSFSVVENPPDRSWNGDANFAGEAILWVADVGDSPSSMTVTIDALNGGSSPHFCAWAVFDVISTATLTVVQTESASESEGGGNSETISVTMGAALASGNTVVCLLAASNDGVGTFTIPTGFDNAPVNQSAISAKVAVAYDTDISGTTVTCSDLGESVGVSAICVLEFTDNAPLPPDLPFVVQSANAAVADRSPSLTFGAAPRQDDVVIMWPSSTTTATITIPSGWANVLGGTTDVESDAHQICCVYHVVTKAEADASTVTFTATNLYDATETGNVVGCVVRFADPVDPINITGTGFNSANTAADHTLPGLTPTVNEGLMLSSIAKDATGAYSVQPTGWTTLTTSNTNQGKWLGSRDTRTTAGSAIAGTDITESAGDEWAAISVVMRPPEIEKGRIRVLPPMAIHHGQDIAHNFFNI